MGKPQALGQLGLHGVHIVHRRRHRGEDSLPLETPSRSKALAHGSDHVGAGVDQADDLGPDCAAWAIWRRGSLRPGRAHAAQDRPAVGLDNGRRGAFDVVPELVVHREVPSFCPQAGDLAADHLVVGVAVVHPVDAVGGALPAGQGRCHDAVVEGDDVPVADDLLDGRAVGDPATSAMTRAPPAIPPGQAGGGGGVVFVVGVQKPDRLAQDPPPKSSMARRAATTDPGR